MIQVHGGSFGLVLCTVPGNLLSSLAHVLQTVLATSMEQPSVAPVCPPGLGSAIARHLVVNGWLWDDELLTTVVTHLADEDVQDTRALVGLDLGDVPAAESWPPEVRAFMVTMVGALRAAVLFGAVRVLFLPDQTGGLCAGSASGTDIAFSIQQQAPAHRGCFGAWRYAHIGPQRAESQTIGGVGSPEQELAA